MFGKVEVEAFQFSDLENLDVPVEMTVTLRANGFAQKRGEEFLLKSAFETEDLIRRTSTAQREFDLLLGSPRSTKTRIRYDFPDGFDPVTLPQPEEQANQNGAFRMRWGRRENSILIERETTYATQRVPTTAYPEFKEFAERIDRAEKQLIVLRPAH
jgi:hypothetical protein